MHNDADMRRYLHYALNMAKQFSAAHAPYHLDDAHSDALLGLTKSLRTWSPARSVKFTSYFTRVALNAMINGYRKWQCHQYRRLLYARDGHWKRRRPAAPILDDDAFESLIARLPTYRLRRVIAATYARDGAGIAPPPRADRYDRSDVWAMLGVEFNVRTNRIWLWHKQALQLLKQHLTNDATVN